MTSSQDSYKTEAARAQRPDMPARRPRASFMTIKNSLHLPGVRELLAAFTAHLSASDYKRMLSAWQTLPQYHVFGFVLSGEVVGLIAIETRDARHGRILSIALAPQQQGRGLGRRLLVESFCSLGLLELSVVANQGAAGFFEQVHFEKGQPTQTATGVHVIPFTLTRDALYRAYAHEFSAGAVLYCDSESGREYVLVTELSGNTGLPKGHVEEGESNQQTALREIYEETGIKAEIREGFGGEIVYPQGQRMLKHFVYFLAVFTPDQEIVSGGDVDAVRLTFDQAMHRLSFSDVRSILRQAELFLNSEKAPRSSASEQQQPG